MSIAWARFQWHASKLSTQLQWSQTKTLRETKAPLILGGYRPLFPDLPVVKEGIGQMFSNWRLELFSGMLIIISFGDLVALLRKYQNKPLPTWPLGFSIDTDLSVFGVIYKGSLLFVAAENISQLKNGNGFLSDRHWAIYRPLMTQVEDSQGLRGCFG